MKYQRVLFGPRRDHRTTRLEVKINWPGAPTIKFVSYTFTWKMVVPSDVTFKYLDID